MLHLPIDRWRAWMPADCPGCGRRQAGQGLCPACLAFLRLDAARPRCPCCAHPLSAQGCPDCAGRPPAYDRVVAAFDYAGLGRDLIQDYKARCRLPLARLLADLLAQALDAHGPSGWVRPDWIVPVPARRVALRRRGFSPPAEVARLLARRLGLRCHLDGVRRIHEGPRQAGLDRAQRLQAQTDAFAVGPRRQPVDRGVPRGLVDAAQPLAGQRIAVVDDVLTTGATLEAVAAVLKAAGAVRVEGWVLARTVAGAGAAADDRVLQ